MFDFFKKIIKVHRTDDYLTEAVSLNAVYARAVVVMVEVFEIVMLLYTVSLDNLKYQSVYISLYLTNMLVSLYGIYYLFFKNKTLREVHNNSRKVYVYSSFYAILLLASAAVITSLDMANYHEVNVLITYFTIVVVSMALYLNTVVYLSAMAAYAVVLAAAAMVLEEKIFNFQDYLGLIGCFVISIGLHFSRSIVDVQQFLNRRELEREKNEYSEKAIVDPLTGLKNRWFLDTIKSSLEKEEKLPEAKRNIKIGAVVMMDIDDYKKANDIYGHLYGDVVLEEFSKVLIAYELKLGKVCIRYGGDEFLILYRSDNREKIMEELEELRKDINGMQIPGGADFQVSVSVGFNCQEVSTAAQLDEAINTADKAMYQSKIMGKNHIVDFTGK